MLGVTGRTELQRFRMQPYHIFKVSPRTRPIVSPSESNAEIVEGQASVRVSVLTEAQSLRVKENNPFQIVL